MFEKAVLCVKCQIWLPLKLCQQVVMAETMMHLWYFFLANEFISTNARKDFLLCFSSVTINFVWAQMWHVTCLSISILVCSQCSVANLNGHLNLFFNRCHVSIHKVTVMILRKSVYNYIPQTIKLSHCLDFEFICVQLMFFLNFKSEFVMFLFKTPIIPEYQHVIFRFVVHKTSRYQIIYRRSRKWLQG